MGAVNGLINELRRRRVFRVAGLYVVGSWVVLQVCDLAFASWGLPDTALRSVWIAALVLFPLALVFGWRMNWQFYAQLTHHLDGIRDSDEYKSIVADIEADLRRQVREFDPDSLL